MINSSYLPPHPKAVEDLLSLLSIVTNPKAVSEYTKGLLESAKAYTEASKGFVDKGRELDAREAEIVKQTAIRQSEEAKLISREKEIERQEKDSSDKAAKAYALLADADSRASDVQNASDKLAHDKANFEQNRLAATANLAEWEKNLKSDIEAHQHKVKALKDLIHV